MVVNSQLVELISEMPQFKSTSALVGKVLGHNTYALEEMFYITIG